MSCELTYGIFIGMPVTPFKRPASTQECPAGHGPNQYEFCPKCGHALITVEREVDLLPSLDFERVLCYAPADEPTLIGRWSGSDEPGEPALVEKLDFLRISKEIIEVGHEIERFATTILPDSPVEADYEVSAYLVGEWR